MLFFINGWWYASKHHDKPTVVFDRAGQFDETSSQYICKSVSASQHFNHIIGCFLFSSRARSKAVVCVLRLLIKMSQALLPILSPLYLSNSDTTQSPVDPPHQAET